MIERLVKQVLWLHCFFFLLSLTLLLSFCSYYLQSYITLSKHVVNMFGKSRSTCRVNIKWLVYLEGTNVLANIFHSMLKHDLIL